MAGLYENVRKDAKKERDTSLTVLIVALVALAVVVLAVAVWLIGYRRRFMNFVGDLSNSTFYAHENESLTAKVDGKTYQVSTENMYGIYSYIALNKSGRESRQVPEGEPVSLDYGNGAVLKLWRQPDDKRPGGYSLFLQYTDADGKVYSYINYKMTLETIVTRYLMYGNIEIDG